jgi:4-amino-4-deoxy-L-arabinose transferase-like glycosyltransferase
MAAAPPAAGFLPTRRPGAAVAHMTARAAPEAAVLGLTAGPRLVALGRVPTNPYYDAAVRSMGGSWAAFLVGAFEPGRRVAIDKPPVDLWLQVATTKAFGFGPVGLLLPAALGGIALVAALMWLLRTLVGRGAALAGGLALAVLPSAVITARSDTMDAVMAALVTAGAALVARSARTGRRAPLVGAGALVGLAFDVKLAEALLPALAVVALWLWAGPRDRRRRATGLALGGAAFVVAALAWLVAVTIVPLHPRPWALGSSNGSPWWAAFVYNGVDRLLPGHGGNPPAVIVAPPPGRSSPHRAAALARREREHALALARRPAPAGPLRLLSGRAHLGRWIGVEAIAALAALAAALALGAWRRLDRVERGGLAALGFWLVGGIALCSAMATLHPRYLALLDPAVAGCLGAGVALVARGRPRAVTLAAGAVLAAVLVAPLSTSLAAVRRATQDSGRTGEMPAARVEALSAFLTARTARAADEVAASAPAKAGALIARDGRPVLILSDGMGRQLVTPRRLAAAVAAGRVRYALLSDACTPASGNARTGCLPVVRWARAHGVDVSREAGQPARALFALGSARSSARAAAASGRRPRSATSRRSLGPAHRAGRSAPRRASRARRRRGARARRSSARHSAASRGRSRRATG